MRILLLGGSGYIGKYFSKFLITRGHSVEIIDIFHGEDYDLSNLKISNLNKFDFIYFLAWEVGGSKFLTDTKNFVGQFEKNLKIINNVFPQLGSANIPYLFVSSQLAGTDQTPYSLTKRTGEIIASSHKNAWIVRLWNVYGDLEEVGQKSHVITDMISQAKQNKKIELITDGKEKRQFIHLDDVCDAFLEVFERPNKTIYKLTSNSWYSILDVAKLVGRLTGSEVVPGKLVGVNPLTNGGQAIPNWKPKITFEEGIEKLIQNRVK